MLSKKLEAAYNAQINAEFWSAYLYLSMAAFCRNEGFNGIGNWFEVQFKEEQDHAMIFYNYVIARGNKVTLAPIAAVDTKWNSPLDAFKSTLSHEQKVTSLINNLYALAVDEKDFASQSMLKWFIDEQVQEEQVASDTVNNLKLLNGNSYGLYMLDKELGARVYTQTAQLNAQA